MKKEFQPMWQNEIKNNPILLDFGMFFSDSVTVVAVH